MKVRTMSYLAAKPRNQALKLFKFIENNDNADPGKNGEMRLFSSFVASKSPKETLTILDCGANKGDWTASCLQHVGDRDCDFHLFEASLACCNELRSRFGSRKNIRINSVGVSDKNEERFLYFDTEASSLSSLYRRRISPTDVLKKEETVHVVRIDEYLTARGVGHVDFLKLDIEGHELHALRGLGDLLVPGRVDAIQFEYGGANVDSGCRLADFYELLGGQGFVICKIMPRYPQRRNYAPFMENFTYANYVALAPGLVLRYTHQ